MAVFFGELDAIYCLCIEERKSFVIEQAEKLGISDKLQIFKAYTPNDEIIQQHITNHLVYPIATNNPIYIASSLGMKEIMLDIIKNKHNFAMIMEDDVLFLENMIAHGNKWLKKDVIKKYFDITKPYNLYLQSSIPENKYYYKSKFPNGGIINNNAIKRSVRYGEPICILNHLTCSLLVKYLYPIIAAFDEYKYKIRHIFNIQHGILVPYICRELSANFNKFDISKLTQSFVRTHNVALTKTIKQPLLASTFYLKIMPSLENIFFYLMKSINPELNIVINSQSFRENTMGYYMGGYCDILDNNYVIGSTISDRIKFKNHPSFIVSVRGKKSVDIVEKKFKFKPIIADLLLLMAKYNPKDVSRDYKYCFIYEKNLKVIFQNSDDTYLFINPLYVDANTLVDQITKCGYVITDNISYITIANSYGIPGIYSTISGDTIDECKKESAEDYYSNITNAIVDPIILECEDDTIIVDEQVSNKIINFVQPVLPIKQNILDEILKFIPFAANVDPKTIVLMMINYAQILDR